MGHKVDDGRVIQDTDDSSTSFMIQVESHMFLTAAEYAAAKTAAGTSQTALNTYLGDDDRGGIWYDNLSSSAKTRIRISLLAA